MSIEATESVKKNNNFDFTRLIAALLVGAASVVTKDIPDYAVVWGNPAKFQYWICECTQKMSFEDSKKFICNCGKTYKLNSELTKIEICR